MRTPEPRRRRATAAAIAVVLAASTLLVAAARRPATTRFEMRHVDLRIDDAVVLAIDELHGELRGSRAGVVPSFDERESMLMRIHGGTAAMTTESFSNLLNRHVFNYEETPLSNIAVEADGTQLRQRATMHKGVAVPVEMTGTVHAEPDGRVRFRPTSMKTAGVPSKGLKDLLGIEVEELLKRHAARGVTIEGDDMLMDIGKMLPPPRAEARVIAIRVEGDRIVQEFGPLAGSEPARDAIRPDDQQARNYLFYRGGTLKFGKLTMDDADVQMVDASPDDPLDFSLDRYYDQLVAGETRNTPDRGLVSIVPDYHRLQRKQAVSRR